MNFKISLVAVSLSLIAIQALAQVDLEDTVQSENSISFVLPSKEEFTKWLIDQDSEYLKNNTITIESTPQHDIKVKINFTGAKKVDPMP